jgi:hypothetical protein
VNHPVVEQLKVDQDAGHGISLENAAVDTECAEYRGALVLQNEEEGRPKRPGVTHEIPG